MVGSTCNGSWIGQNFFYTLELLFYSKNSTFKTDLIKI